MDDMGSLVITNNSMGGSSGLVGAKVENPLFGPTSMNGTGCGILITKGITATKGSGCGSVPYSLTGFPSYAMDAPFTNSGTIQSTAGIIAPIVTGVFTSATAINVATECTGSRTLCSGASANNALTASLVDANGAAVTLGDGATISLTAGHSLRAGANTLNLNNLGVIGIFRPQDGGNLTQAWGPTHLILQNIAGAFWFLVGGY